jgi:membrane-associated phospholipid phosphatase
VRHVGDRRLAGAALVTYLALGLVSRRPPRGLEHRLFASVNHDRDEQPLWRLPQQLGTPWTLPALAVAGFLRGRPHLTVVAACALPVEKGLEVGLKKVLQRKRPARADPRAVLHDDAPEEGPSYPSGHAAIAAAAVVALLPYLPPAALAAGALVAVTTSAARVRQGAHFPLDAVGGLALGVGVGAGLTALVGRPPQIRR